MIISVLKEVINNENRVALLPSGAAELVFAGHEVLVEQNAGQGSGFADKEYREAGAKICSKEEAYRKGELILKVKELTAAEYQYLHPGMILFTYLHLANNLPFLKALMENKVTAIAYETVMSKRNTLPLLTPMSEVAGRMSVQIGAELLQKSQGGSGILLGGVPGVLPAEVVVIGGGTVGFNAARIANGLGAEVYVFDINADRMAYIDEVSNGTIHTIYNNEYNLSKALKTADLVIGAVLIPGAKTPKLVSEAMVKTMKKGSVIVDVAIDQGGCIATCDHITTHAAPTYLKHGVIHYSVANMPGAVPRTSTMALSNATFPYVLKLAKEGLTALKDDPYFRLGLNVYNGYITHRDLADSVQAVYTDPLSLL